MTQGDDLLPVHVKSDEQRREEEQERAEQQMLGDLELLEVMERAYELHRAGVGYRGIAEEIGRPVTTTYRLVQRYIRYCVGTVLDVGTYRGEQLAEINLMRRRVIAEAMVQPRADRPWHFATPILIKLQEREEKLTGMSSAPSPDEFEAMTDEELAAYVA